MRAALALLMFWLAGPALAQTVVTSAAPESVSVTVYRDPGRGEGGIDADRPTGFALVTEKRRITLPQGDAVIRFEGVMDGMIAVSAVVTGLPGGVIQKNRDAKLLSPAALLDGTLGNRVHLRRTNRVTGEVREVDAVIRSGADNAVVLQTAEGFEGLRCSGLPEGLSYDAIPSGLSARPTLSVTTSGAQAITADLTLTYLATGFDWAANYVARVAPDGRTLDLFAWLTVANGNSIGLPDAQLLAVAGRLNRESDYDAIGGQPDSPYLSLRCWSLPRYDMSADDGYPPPPPPPPPSPAPMMMRAEAMEDVVVTASRVARQEDLGDLKLYRVPMQVDVNANGQKQVALLQRAAVPFTLFYAADIVATDDDETPRPLKRMIRMQNETKAGLGLPLPSGGVAIFAPAGASNESLLLADSRLRDHAIGETVKLDAGTSNQHRLTVGMAPESTDDRPVRQLTLSNANNRPAQIEVHIRAEDGDTLTAKGAKLSRKDGAWFWAVTVPANGTARLRYTIASDR